VGNSARRRQSRQPWPAVAPSSRPAIAGEASIPQRQMLWMNPDLYLRAGAESACWERLNVRRRRISHKIFAQERVVFSEFKHDSA
jgi:hypothetical protein